MDQYIFHLLITLGIYSLLAYSLNLVVGYGGLVSFCHAAFYGIGAYTYALASIGRTPSPLIGDLLITGSASFPVAMGLAGLAGALCALLIGAVALRFRGDFFVFSSLGFQMIVVVILFGWVEIGRGPYGIYGIPRAEILGWTIDAPWKYALFVVGANVLLLPVLFLLYRSPFGLTLKALREDERAAESLGISALRQQLSAFVIAGACAGLTGAIFASYITYIDPGSFGLKESIFLLTLLLLGGAGNAKGPFVGAVIMVALPEVLRFVGLPDSVAPNVREMIYGTILIALMYWRPQGIQGEFAVR